jgi:hypothetical protein
LPVTREELLAGGPLVEQFAADAPPGAVLGSFG